MPFDLWFKSTANPVKFQPERIPVPPLDNYAMAKEVQRFFEPLGMRLAEAGMMTAAPFEVTIVEVDDAGVIVPENLPADDLNAIDQGAMASAAPTVTAADGSVSVAPIALPPSNGAT